MNPWRCEVCKRRKGPSPEYLYTKPNGTEIWLCGRKSCDLIYNDPVCDESCDCGKHGERSA